MATAKKQKDGTWRIQPCITIGAVKYVGNLRAPTKREAEELGREWIERKKKYSNSNDLTLHDAVEFYIETKSSILSPTTLAGYKKILRNAFPELMLLKVSKITQIDLQKAVNEYAKSKSPKTVHSAYSLVLSSLKLFGYSFTSTLPRIQKSEIFIPSDEQVQEFYRLLKGTPLEAPFLLATQCGCRESEVCGLHKSKIHDDYISVTEAKVYADKQVIKKAPKSVSGYRDIPTSPELCRKLKEFAEQNPSGYVTELSTQAISKRWHRFTNSCNLDKRVTFHALRHFYASKALLLGVPPRYISELMGHSSQDMINKVYVHTFPKEKHDFAKAISESTKALFLDEN